MVIGDGTYKCIRGASNECMEKERSGDMKLHVQRYVPEEAVEKLTERISNQRYPRQTGVSLQLPAKLR